MSIMARAKNEIQKRIKRAARIIREIRNRPVAGDIVAVDRRDSGYCYSVFAEVKKVEKYRNGKVVITAKDLCPCDDAGTTFDFAPEHVERTFANINWTPSVLLLWSDETPDKGPDFA